MSRPLAYLAVPYSHEQGYMRQHRFECANRAAADLMLRGEVVFSPISHTHPIAQERGLPGGWDFWERFDRAYLSCSQKLYVLMLDGWRESKGVQAEIAIAESMDIPVIYLEPNSVGAIHAVEETA